MDDILERLNRALADRYRIERELGQGGMATVYLAQDLRHNRQVALKVLREELAATLGDERFHREIQIAAQLQHPNILPLLDSGEAAGCFYYTMPYVEGQSLRERLAREGALPIPDAVRILRDVADALTEAHAHGVVHRDIKPENILLRGRHALVADFGVAKAVSEATGRQTLTTAGVALGTPAYMAPEQASADPHLDQRVDIYALGAVAYELLTGRPVFMGTSAQMVLSAHMTETPRPIHQFREAVPPALEALVLRCLAKQRADRWQSAEEVLAQLEALATPSGGITPTQTRPVPALRQAPRWARWAAAMGAMVVLVVATELVLRPKPLTITISDIAPVTSEPGVEFQPAISPDGKEVAYLAGPITAPHLVIRSTANMTGSGEARLSDTSFVSNWYPAWSADGELVRFYGCRTGGCGWYETGKLGGAARAIALPAGAESPAWAADGRVAFILGDTIFTAQGAGSSRRRVAVHPVVWPPLHSLAWSPDGKLITYVNGNPVWRTSGNIAGSSIWVVKAEGGKPTAVTTDEYLNTSPVWLDVRHLLFVSNQDGPRGMYVVEVGVNGARGEPRAIPGVADPHSISYAAAAKKLVYAKSTLRQNIWSFGIGRPGGISVREGRPVTSGNQVIEDHQVSPDGRWIVFNSNRRGNSDLYGMPVAGGEAVPLTDSPGDEFYPRWSPDGEELAFVLVPPGNFAVMPAAGGLPTTLTGASAAYTYAFPVWSKTGLAVALAGYSSGRGAPPDIWLASRDSIGGAWHQPAKFPVTGWVPTDWAPDGSGFLCRSASAPSFGSSLALVSLRGQLVWQRDLASTSAVTLDRWTIPRYSLDGSTIYFAGTHKDSRRGIWATPAAGGPAHLVVRFDDPTLTTPGYISVGPARLYVTVSQYESDIWAMNLRW